MMLWSLESTVTAVTHFMVHFSIRTAAVRLCWGCFICTGDAHLQEWDLQAWTTAHILCAVKGFDACGYHSQHWHGRMLERPLQILALSRDEIIDYSSNLLWSEKSTSFLEKQQTYTWYHNSSIRHKMRTLGLLCANKSGMETHFPRIHTKYRSSFCLNSQKQDLHVFPGGNLLWWDHSDRLSWLCAQIVATLQLVFTQKGEGVPWA